MPIKAKDVMDTASAALNDAGLTVFSYATQLPYVKIAIRDLRLELEDFDIPLTQSTSTAFTITTSMRDIGGTTGPLFPTDFLEPQELWERTAGTTSDYIRMTRRDALPKTDVLTAYLEVWCWQNGQINFLGATGSIEVKMDYLSDPFKVEIVNYNSIVVPKYENALQFLGFRTAGLCAEFIGENPERAQSLYTQAQGYLDLMLGISIKNQQTVGTRRRPFRGGWKRRGVV